MPHVNLYNVAIEFAVAYLFILAFILIGHVLWKLTHAEQGRTSSSYGDVFWRFLAGLLLSVTVYSIVVSKGITINILLLPLLYFLFVQRKHDALKENLSQINNLNSHVFFELGFVTLLSIFILHLFPESEYKQADSFFYLKISESLNANGQENISHYFNNYSVNYNGVEPYHYFELWLTGMIIRITDGFYPSIYAERFIAHGMFLTGIVLALYFLVAEVVQKKVSWSQKILCWALIFFLPDLLSFFPRLLYVFVSNFEGNMLERPNFRTIYLLLIPIVIDLFRPAAKNRSWVYLLLMLCIMSFVSAAVILPSLLLYFIWVKFSRKASLYKSEWWMVLLFGILLGMFYLFVGSPKLPSVFNTSWSDFAERTLHGFKFIAYSIVTSVLYLLIITVLFLLPFFLYGRKQMQVILKDAYSRYLPLLVVGFFGILMARIFYQKDNSYQFIFITDIIVTMSIWLVIVLFTSRFNKSSLIIGSALFLSSFFIIKAIAEPKAFFTDIFQQNGNFVYDGKKYSKEYLDAVSEYFKHNRNIVGGYIADSSFYSNTYYSRRNPNVYFLPATYIMAAQVNRNFEFCLSDSSDIMTGITYPLEADYLKNAISRSFFQQYQLTHKGSTYSNSVEHFIEEYQLQYLFVTDKVMLDSSLIKKVIRDIWDANTGEHLLILKDVR